MNVYGSSGRTAAARSATSASSRPRPRSRSSSSAIAPSTGSTAMIASSAGRSPRTSSILATCEASSQTMNRDSELPATHAHSDGELVG